jgi:hypothetical protein
MERRAVVEVLNWRLRWVIGQLFGNHRDWKFSCGRVRFTKDNTRVDRYILDCFRFSFKFARPDAHNISILESCGSLLGRWVSESPYEEKCKQVV